MQNGAKGIGAHQFVVRCNGTRKKEEEDEKKTKKEKKKKKKSTCTYIVDNVSVINLVIEQTNNIN